MSKLSRRCRQFTTSRLLDLDTTRSRIYPDYVGGYVIAHPMLCVGGYVIAHPMLCAKIRPIVVARIPMQSTCIARPRQK